MSGFDTSNPAPMAGFEGKSEYEYRISAADPRRVEVRRMHGDDENLLMFAASSTDSSASLPAAKHQNPLNWRLYLLCDHEEQAAHILNLLQRPLPEEEVVHE